MHKNVNINNKMLSLLFYRVIKAASIAEKNFITRVRKKFHNPLTRVMKFFSAMLVAFITL
jgi:hypothetical protein